VCRVPRRDHAKRLGDGKTRPQPVLMETIAGPRTTEPGVALALNLLQALLREKCLGVVLWMIVDIATERQVRVRIERRVQAEKQGATFVDALQAVHPVSYRDIVQGRALARPAQEVP